jgi:four helix bundle protein
MLKNFRTFQLATELYEACEKVEAKYYLRDQLLRASLSAMLNVAEGSAKPTPKERQRFYSIALASTREVQALIHVMKLNHLDRPSDELGACLYRLTHPR